MRYVGRKLLAAGHYLLWCVCVPAFIVCYLSAAVIDNQSTAYVLWFMRYNEAQFWHHWSAENGE